MSLPSQAIECVASGCSGQLCLEKSVAENTISTCEWNNFYACYPKFSKCEVQSDGKCGWTKTSDLNKCLEDAQAATLKK